MIIKDVFKTINARNTLQLSKSDLVNVSLPKGPLKIANVLHMIEDKVRHFTKARIYRYLSERVLYTRTAVLVLPQYPFFISWNEPTNQIVINLYNFGVDDIYPNNPDPINLYACMVYGICFSNLANRSVIIEPSNYLPMASFLFSVFTRLFGKEYGFSTIFSRELLKLNFLLQVYVQCSFFGISSQEAIRRASVSSGFDYRDYVDFLSQYDFSDTNHFIACLSDFKIMPGLTKFDFARKFVRFFGVEFLPAVEDVARFVSVLTCSSIPGSSIVPTYLSKKYNTTEFSKVVEISKVIFSRSTRVTTA